MNQKNFVKFIRERAVAKQLIKDIAVSPEKAEFALHPYYFPAQV